MSGLSDESNRSRQLAKYKYDMAYNKELYIRPSITFTMLYPFDVTEWRMRHYTLAMSVVRFLSIGTRHEPASVTSEKSLHIFIFFA